jgi:glycosyltransferase involved in cell wall biosynthesis
MSEALPLVSCVVPVCNGEAYLAEAIDSILRQTYQPVEIIVIDDASADRSAEIATGCGDPVRLLSHSENRGTASARTTGVLAARGEYVAFLDADDLWLPEKIACQLAHLEGPPRFDVSFCQIENFWEPGQEAEEERWRRARRTLGTYLLQTGLARRDVLERVPLRTDHRYFEHAAWLLDLRAAGVSFGVVTQTLVLRRRHALNTTRGQETAHYDAVFDLLKQSLDRRRAQES